MAVMTIGMPDDSGNVDVASSSDDGSTTTTIVPRLVTINGTPRWWWVYFSLSNANGETRTIRINKTGFFLAASFQQTWKFSEDGGSTWTPFTPSDDATYFYYAKGSAFSSATVLVAASEPFPMGRWDAAYGDWAAFFGLTVFAIPGSESPLIWDHTEGTAGHGQTDDIGRTVLPQAIYAFRIGEATPKRNCILLTGGNHPGETTAEHGLLQSITWAMGNSAEAIELRSLIDVYVIANINPEGKRYGYFRSCPETSNDDNNRIWAIADQGLNSTVDKVRNCILTATAEQELLAHFDYHYRATADAFLYLNTQVPKYGGRQSQFRRTLVANYGGTIALDVNPAPGSAGWFATEIQDWGGAKTGILLEQDQDWTLAQNATFHLAVEATYLDYARWSVACNTPFTAAVEAMGADHHYRLTHSPRMILGPDSFLPGGSSYVSAPSLIDDPVGADTSMFFNNLTQINTNNSDTIAYNAAGNTWVGWLQYPDPLDTNFTKYVIGRGTMAPGATGPGYSLGFASPLYSNYPIIQMFCRDSANNGNSLEIDFSGYDDGEIHQWAFGWGTNSIRVWIDGVVVYDFVGTFNPALMTPAASLRVGARSDGNSSRLWNGRLDEIIRFPRLLTTEEVLELQEYADNIFPPPPVSGVRPGGSFRLNIRPWRNPA